MATMGVTFIVLLLIGVPIAFVLGWSAFIYAWTEGSGTLRIIPLQMFAGVDKFLFLAVPLFMFGGELMVCTGIMPQLVRFNSIILGRFRGSLAHVAILSSMVFADISGSAVADASAIGAVMIPAMSKEYNNEYGAGIVAGASAIGPIIPPSLPAIIYAMAVGGISVGGLFLAGVVPGILIGVGMMVIAYVKAVRNKFPASKETISFKIFIMAFIKVIPALLMPLIVVGGIMSGIFTATEAAAVAVLYCLIIGFLTRTLRWKDLWKASLQSAKVSSMVFLLISTASVLAWMLIDLKLPEIITMKLKEISPNPWIFLLLLNLFLLIVGCLIDPAAAIVMLAPIIAPIATSFGIHPLHIGIVFLINLILGMLTPPVGSCLFVVCGIAKLPLLKVFRSASPYLAWELAVLGIVTYVPGVALFIPFWLGFG